MEEQAGKPIRHVNSLLLDRTIIQNENKQNKLTPTETRPDQRMNAQKTI